MKIIREILPKEFKVPKESQDLIIEAATGEPCIFFFATQRELSDSVLNFLCAEFLQMLSSQSNDACTKAVTTSPN